MPMILTIGYDHFFIASEDAAMKAMKALSGAVPVDYDYDKDHTKVWFPSDRKEHKQVGMEVIQAKQWRKTRPTRPEDLEIQDQLISRQLQLPEKTES